MDAMFAETLITNMPDAVVYSDRGGTIRYWNSAAEQDVRPYRNRSDRPKP